MTKDERAAYTGLNVSSLEAEIDRDLMPPPLTTTTDKLPKYVNWVTRGATVPVKNQENCGVCWAFGGVAALEGIYYIKTGDLVSFSEQEILDCGYEIKGLRQSDQLDGCEGGNFDAVYRRIAKAGRLASTKKAPYTGVDGECAYDNTDNSFTKLELYGASPYKFVFGTDDFLMKQISMQPTAVRVHVSRSFRAYRSGIYKDNWACSRGFPNHAVVAVGYGEKNGNPYWLVSVIGYPYFATSELDKLLWKSV